MSKITIFREKFWPDSMRDYIIMMDGKEAGRIEQGDTKIIEIEPGTHEIYLKIDWCRSNKIKFNTAEREEVKFKCRGPNLLAAFYTLIIFNRRIKLSKEQ